MRVVATLVLLACLFFTSVSSSLASTEKYGIHILHPEEIERVAELFNLDELDSSQGAYVTIPFALSDREKKAEWQSFFDRCKELSVVPIVRIATEFDGTNWTVPTRKDVVELFKTLSDFDWPQEQRIVIIFNEVNHAKEWGGTVDPQGYADMLLFATNWAHTQPHPYYVLPAAMDLAAPQSAITWDAYAFLTGVYRARSEAFSLIDGWNSHSYPNPAFSASPSRTGRMSLRGYQQELVWLSQWTDKQLPVFITETGWEINASTKRWLSQYYLYAVQHVWSDERIVAVTPFVLKGEPGPFANFSFLTGDDKPTAQYVALQKALKSVCGNNCPQSISMAN